MAIFVLARDLHFRLMPIFHAAFIETNPIPLKLHEFCGFPAGKCRLPLCDLSPGNISKVEQTLKEYFESNQLEALTQK